MTIFDDWRDDAACQGSPVSLWYPELTNAQRPAKRICAACPVQAQCLQHALDAGEAYGIWGGLNERERRHLRRGDVKPAPRAVRHPRPPAPFIHGRPGTSGYQRHLREHTEPCTPCRAAAAEYRKSRREASA